MSTFTLHLARGESTMALVPGYVIATAIIDLVIIAAVAGIVTFAARRRSPVHPDDQIQLARLASIVLLLVGGSGAGLLFASVILIDW